MLGEIIGDGPGVIHRAVGHVRVEVVFEIGVKGVRYSICRLFRRNVDPDGRAASLAGRGFWIVVGLLIYSLGPWSDKA